ncbi:MAG TPA: hypothetical protein PKM57_15250 [Kiritimatiellia bacterium]|nr:hypothetical protein [Kiritimatiellia bacterium]HPS07661.1 hypothetical protein [Kiritimatiellia bacterium]
MDAKTKNELDAYVVQQHQAKVLGSNLARLDSAIADLSDQNDANLEKLDALLASAENFCATNSIDVNHLTADDIGAGAALCELSSVQVPDSPTYAFDDLQAISVEDDWQSYVRNINAYAERNHIDLGANSIDRLLSFSQRAEIAKRVNDDYTLKRANCDKYDYLIATFCGFTMGLIDVFFVGMPGQSALGEWTSQRVDDCVIGFAKIIYRTDGLSGKNVPRNIPDTIARAIGFLEKRFTVNYDQRHTQDVNSQFDMASKNHHLKSLGHSPDIIGLFFSILDQFQNTATFVSDGTMIRIDTKSFELEGGTLVAKIFCGFCNWLGHVMSDIAGSSGSRGQPGGGGSGLPIPFYELLQFCDFGNFGKDRQTLGTIFVRVFQEGYDFRHGAAMAIPVALNELFIRGLWAIKSRYYHKREWKDSVPFGNKPELRRMLLVGHGALCLVDGTDAAIRSRLDPIQFLLHANMIAWSRFALAALKEVRLYVKSDVLDTDEMERDLNREWDAIFAEYGCRTSS